MVLPKCFLPCLLILTAAATGNAQWVEPPPGPADPSTISTCTYWALADADAVKDCHSFSTNWGVSWQDFTSWNPEIKDDCTGMILNNAYCIENNHGQPVTTTSSTAPPTSSSTITISTKTGPIAPGPTQGLQDPNCNAWDFVKSGETCQDVEGRHPGVTLADLVKWNPYIGDDCSKMWGSNWVCVSISSWAPPPTTTTKPSNGITTPSPIQPGQPTDCSAWHFVVKDENCATIAQALNIPLSQFLAWNPSAKADCSGLQANTYACTGTLSSPAGSTGGGKPTQPPTTTTSIVCTKAGWHSTPSPIQTNMSKTCNRFHKVVANDQCGTLASKYGITLAQFYAWNPTVKGDCSALWLDTYVCVGQGALAPCN